MPVWKCTLRYSWFFCFHGNCVSTKVLPVVGLLDSIKRKHHVKLTKYLFLKVYLGFTPLVLNDVCSECNISSQAFWCLLFVLWDSTLKNCHNVVSWFILHLIKNIIFISWLYIINCVCVCVCFDIWKWFHKGCVNNNIRCIYLCYTSVWCVIYDVLN